MATTKDYIEYVCERLHGAGGLRYRKMFGEYMVYVNDKPRYRRYRPRTAGRRGAGDGHAAAEAEKEEGRVACQRRAGVLQ